ncbi:MAG: tetratricopeptide repeat protein [Stellaceae bacterium]
MSATAPAPTLQQAIALLQRGRWSEAEPLFRALLVEDPDDFDGLHGLGIIRAQQGMPDEAIALISAALERDAASPHAHNNLANALQMRGRHAHAIEHYERALALKPDYVEAHRNLAAALRALNRHAAAIARFEQAIALQPDDAEAHLNAALAHLALGDFAVGWREYEWRWRHGGGGFQKPAFAQPRWLGEGDLAGRTMLLYAEQGLGDTLQFARYVPLLAERGARIVLEVQDGVRALLSRLPGVVACCAQGEALPPFDYHSPLLSLPLALGTRLETIPAEVPYLAPPAATVARWRSRLRGTRGFKVGVVWAGSATHCNDRNRSVPLELLRGLLSGPGVRFLSLQKELRAGDAALLRSLAGLRLLGEELEDFTDTAAVISLLDLVITVDTAVAHLAGALGKKVWILLPFSPDWRWLLAREDSPWYPSARLFRQPATGDWASVLARVATALRQLAARRGMSGRRSVDGNLGGDAFAR